MLLFGFLPGLSGALSAQLRRVILQNSAQFREGSPELF